MFVLRLLMSLLRRFFVDRALAFSLAGRIWQILSGPITIGLIVIMLSPAQQGVYYALISIVGLQAFVELGLLNVLISYTGHEAIKLAPQHDRSSTVSDARPLGSELAAQRIAAMIAGATRWFGWMSLVYVVVAILFGIWTFSSSAIEVGWLAPMVCLIVVSAANIAISPLLAILEGAGQREDIYQCRLFQIMSGSVAVWGFLAAGLGIWALVASAMTQLVWSAYIAHIRHRDLLTRLQVVSWSTPVISWVTDVVPAQWRVAAISLSHHLATQLLVICVLKYSTAEDAGRLGMTLAVTSAIQIISQTWLQANFPVISAKHGAGRSVEAGALWRQLALTSTLVLASALLAAWLMIQLLVVALPQVAERFLEPYQVAILAIGALASHQLSIQGLYVLAKSKSPLARAAVGGFLLTAVSVWAGGAIAGLDGVLVSYSAGLAIVALPLHTAAYWIHRKAAASSQIDVSHFDTPPR